MSVAAGLVSAMSANELEVDGEMHGDAALNEANCSPRSQSGFAATGARQICTPVMPNIDAANISYNLLKMTGGEAVAWCDHWFFPSSSVRRPVMSDLDGDRVRRLVNYDRAGGRRVDGR